MKFKVVKIKCKRCGHKWQPQIEDVKMCAKCKSKYFNADKAPRPGRKK